MTKEEYIRQLKLLIKKYHPDLCHDKYLKNEYNEITVKLNNKLNQIKNNENINSFDNKSLINIADQSYVYYRLGIKYYQNIHPNQFYKTNADKTFAPKTYEEQLKILNEIYASFISAEYYFTKVILEYPKSEWANDAKDKIKLLKRLYKSYENTDIERYNQIMDGNKYLNEMGLSVL
jgi:hypothetical protein